MRRTMKNLTALALAVAMVLSMGVISFAAGAASPYGVSVSGTKISFVKDGKTANTYEAKDTNIRLKLNDTGSLLVCFYNTSGAYKGVNLGDQKTIALTGSMDSLTLDSNLGSGIAVTLDSGAKVSSMSVKSQGNVTIKGSVSTLTVSGSAKVSLVSGATVSTAKITASKATLSAPEGSNVANLDAVDRSNVTGSGIGKVGNKTSKSSSVDYFDDDDDDDDDNSKIKVTLSIDSIDAEEGDKLRDLEGELRSAVSAYATDKNDNDVEVKGSYKFNKSGSTEVKKTETYKFTFTPSNSKYETVSGSITIYVD